jgi:biotin carboxyl carrier protein
MVIIAPHSGKVESLQVKAGDSVDGQDLVCKLAKLKYFCPLKAKSDDSVCV